MDRGHPASRFSIFCFMATVQHITLCLISLDTVWTLLWRQNCSFLYELSLAFVPLVSECFTDVNEFTFSEKNGSCYPLWELTCRHGEMWQEKCLLILHAQIETNGYFWRLWDYLWHGTHWLHLQHKVLKFSVDLTAEVSSVKTRSTALTMQPSFPCPCLIHIDTSQLLPQTTVCCKILTLPQSRWKIVS